MQCATNSTVLQLNTKMAELEARAAETWTPAQCVEEGSVAVSALLVVQVTIVLIRLGKFRVSRLGQQTITIHVAGWRRWQAWRLEGVAVTPEHQAAQLVLASGVVTSWLEREAARSGQRALADSLQVSRAWEIHSWVMA